MGTLKEDLKALLAKVRVVKYGDMILADDHNLTRQMWQMLTDRWDEIAPPVLPTWGVIADVTLETDQTYIDFTGLDLNADRCYVFFATPRNPLDVSVAIYLFVEGDYTLTNWYTAYWQLMESPLFLYGYLNEPYFCPVYRGYSSHTVAWIVRDPDGRVRWTWLSSARHGDLTMGITGNTVSTPTYPNVTQIRLQASEAGGIGAGSRFTLCRVKTP